MDATWGPHQSPPGRAVPHVNYFIRPLGDVVDDGVLPKSQTTTVESDMGTLESRFATVASYVDCVSAMTWGAMSAKNWVVWGLKGVHFDVPSNTCVFRQTLSVV